MKSIMSIFIVSLLGLGSVAQAFKVESTYTQQESGRYVKVTRVTCDAPDGGSCLQLCQNQQVCERVEPYCRNCAGTTSPLLRQLFTEIAKVYKIKGALTDSSPLVNYLGNQLYTLLDVKSIFNYYTPIGADSFIEDLKSFCGDDASNSLLAVTLDEVHQPRELKYVLCRNQQNQTVAFEVEERRPDVGPHALQTPIFFQLM